MTEAERPDAPSTTDRDFQAVRDAKYVLLTTFKRDGTGVGTPVWAVPVETDRGTGIRIWTARNTGKVKRIRNGSRVTVAPCSMRGVPTGAAVEAHAVLLDDDDTRGTLEALAARYGMAGRLVTRRARRDVADSAGIEVNAA
ncbi:PPOX class F420-dependent oxidoreductase [Agromyces rhizosphaerae]|uniref:PPOX class F420-dependent oxidoreductase n=1 Tax=Agromyces rhizosphaerae TaxID=88374 RepID=A0A9W6FPB0_9MICO|nr:PPOX class F420-dependent oxidoreductase [Agromyces rhizosphaerae]GLI27346.1 PPOX class F420-dependent oxidoreductase [Agromyces rhizosphaerae]